METDAQFAGLVMLALAAVVSVALTPQQGAFTKSVQLVGIVAAAIVVKTVV